MAIDPVKIPQNVYVEDRIIGPVTLKQLTICGIGAGISYAMYATASKAGPVGIPMIVLLWSPAMVAAAFAFVKINDLTLFNIILLMIEHANKPNLRYWSPHTGISINFVSRATKQAYIEANTKIGENATKLAELTRQMEKREEALAQLAAHEQPPIASPPGGARRMDDIVAVSASIPATVGSQTEAPVGEAHADTSAQEPEADASQSKERGSLDGITSALDSFKHIFPTD